MTWVCRRRHSKPAPVPPPRSPRDLRAAEDRADDLEQRADRVADKISDRLRRNNFAEGIAMSWGQSPRHRRGGV